MNQKKIMIILCVLAVAAFAVFIQKTKIPKKGLNDGVLSWTDLQEYDYKNKIAPTALKKLDYKKAKIAGYVVPLQDEYTELTEFILVPNPQACVHDPSPPPNLIVHVKLAHAIPKEKVHNPAWIEGTFIIESVKNEHSEAAFKMNDATLDEYKD